MLPIQPVDAPLYVVTPITNPARYRSRYHLYREFAEYVAASGAILYTGEGALGERPFEITDATNPHHVQLRYADELWHKESIINLLIQRLPADWRYVAVIDADVMFARKDWVAETIHQLQHTPVVQMFKQAVDLGPQHQPLLPPRQGFVSQWVDNGCDGLPKAPNYGIWHPGFAWAYRRDAVDALGGLIDFSIIGSADFYMAYSLIGQADRAITPAIAAACPVFAQWIKNWQDRAETHIKRNIGYMDGLLLHYWHGRKKQRGYATRSSILVDNAFDPSTDIKRDAQGLLCLNGNKPKLRDQLRAYFRSRNEDANEM